MQNVSLDKMGVALAEHLKADAGIKAFCNEVFGKDIAILVGDPTDSSLPTEDDAPYIFMWGFKKKEGLKMKNPCEYICNFGLGVYVKDDDSETDSGVVIFGGFERITQLQNLVQHSLNDFNDGCKPPDEVETDIMGALDSGNSHWAANICATWQEPQTLGMDEITDF